MTPRWRLQAVCHDADPDIFFPHRGDDYSEARTFCARCPVRKCCLEDVMDYEFNTRRHGMVGGLSPQEREDYAATRPRRCGQCLRPFMGTGRDTYCDEDCARLARNARQRLHRAKVV